MLFVTQPKLQIMCLHFLRQLHRLHPVRGEMVNVTAITVVPVSLRSSYQYVLCVCNVCVVGCGPVWVRSVRVRVCLVCVVKVCQRCVSTRLRVYRQNARVLCDTGVLPAHTEAS